MRWPPQKIEEKLNKYIREDIGHHTEVDVLRNILQLGEGEKKSRIVEYEQEIERETARLLREEQKQGLPVVQIGYFR